MLIGMIKKLYFMSIDYIVTTLTELSVGLKQYTCSHSTENLYHRYLPHKTQFMCAKCGKVFYEYEY